MSKTKDKEPTTTTERWTYIGRRLTSGGKLKHGFLRTDAPVRSDREEAELGVWYLGRVGATVIGGLYDVQLDAEGSLFTRGKRAPTYCGRKSPPASASWEGADRAAYLEARALAKERKAARGTEVAAALRTLWRAYYGASHAQRPVLLADMVRQITGHGKGSQ